MLPIVLCLAMAEPLQQMAVLECGESRAYVHVLGKVIASAAQDPKVNEKWLANVQDQRKLHAERLIRYADYLKRHPELEERIEAGKNKLLENEKPKFR